MATTPETDLVEGDPLGLFSESSNSLTMKQRLFAQAYVDNGGNGTQAAITAGYPEAQAPSRGSDNVRNRKVLAEIQRRYDLRTNASGATADYALAAIRDNLEAAKAAERYSDVNKAAELIGKYHKLFTDKLEHSGQIESLAVVTPEMTLEQAELVYMDNVKALRADAES